MLSDMSLSQKGQIMSDSTYMRNLEVVEFLETESRMVAARGRRRQGLWGGRPGAVNRKLLFNGCRIFIL